MISVKVKYICRLIVLAVSSLVFANCIHAQTIDDLSNLNREKLQKADEFYQLQEFYTALELYLEVSEKAPEDTAIICRVANTYRMLNDHVNAEQWYKKAVVNNESTISPQYKFYLAGELTTNGKYDEALYWFKEYNKSEANDKRALASIESIENLSTLYSDTTFYVVNPVEINSRYAEFSPVSYKDNIVFLTDKDNSTSGYITWYTCRQGPNGNLTGSVKLENQVKIKYNAGPLTFYDNFKNVIFSQNYSRDKLNKKKINEIPVQLFSADVNEDDSWVNVQLLPFINNDFSYTQPSVSADGKTLYFASDIPGGFGGIDLYKSEFINGSWGEPENLGAKINTMGNELFPFIFNDSVLFFASDGHGGLGGLDILKVKIPVHEGITKIGMPINSSADDFGMMFNDDGLSGYFSSNREGSVGQDDIYIFTIIRVSLTITIIDQATSNPVSNASVTVISNGKENRVGTTDYSGNCELIIPVDEEILIQVHKDDFESQIISFKPKNIAEENTYVLMAENQMNTDNSPSIGEDIIIYKVQIAAGRVPLTTKILHDRYKGNMKVSMSFEDGWYKYTIGEFQTYDEARKCLYQCRVYDAFIPVYKNNKRIQILFPRKIIKK